MKTFALETSAETAAYDYLSRLSSDRWAWEYVRRNDDFRDDAATRTDDDISEMKADCADIRILRSRVPQTLAERWGLIFMPDPDLNGLEADALPVLEGCSVLQEDQFFLLNKHPDSLDGRYFGAIERSELVGVARPLMTADE